MPGAVRDRLAPLIFTNQFGRLGASWGESPQSEFMKKIWYFGGALAPRSWVCNMVRPLTPSERFAKHMVEGYTHLINKLNMGWHHRLEGKFEDMSVSALRERALAMIAEYEPQMRKS